MEQMIFPGGLKTGGVGLGRHFGPVHRVSFGNVASVSNDVALTTAQNWLAIERAHRVRAAGFSATAATAVAPATDPAVDIYQHLPVPDAPTLALISPAAAGNVDDGAHDYVVTFVSAAGETTPSGPGVGTVVAKGTNGKIVVTLPLGPTGTTARKIYRSIAAGHSPLYLATVSDNTTTTYTDNIADASIGVIPGAVTVALPGTPVAGNVEDGDHDYAVTFVTASGETLPSAVVVLTVVDKATNGKGNITAIPLGPAGTTARKLYRSEAAAHSLKLLTTLNDNTTTTYLDNIADASLTTAAPSTSTAFPPPITNTAAFTVLSATVKLSEADRNLVHQPIAGVMVDAAAPLDRPACIYSLRALTGASSGAITNLKAWMDVEYLS